MLPIIIRTATNHMDIFSNKRTLFTIESLHNSSLHLLRHCACALGYFDGKDIERHVVLNENNIETCEFSTQVLACLLNYNYQASSKNSSTRKN